MTSFYHDVPSNTLIYPRHALITQTIPEAREINGQFVAVPRSLHNCQVLRHYNFPVAPIITDETYNWPRPPNVKQPYESQKTTANFLVLHPRSFVLSEMGCVAGSTLLETSEGPVPIEHLATQTKPTFKLKSCTDQGVRFVTAQKPFCKGTAKLYRIGFASGRSITVTKDHVFLTSRGWLFCGDLAVGESLPIFDGDLQVSNAEFSLSKFQQDAHHSTYTPSNFRGYYQSQACGEQLPLEVDTDLVLAPLQDDFLTRTPLELREDDPDTRYKRSHHFYDDLRSTRRYIDLIDPQHTEYLAFVCSAKHAGNQNCNAERYHLLANLQQAILSASAPQYDCARYQTYTGSYLYEREGEPRCKSPYISERYERYPNLPQQDGEHLQLKTLASPLATPVDTVTHITYLKTDVYYDLHVPKHENYIAHGVCNHNTGKTLSTLWAADFLMRQHPSGAFKALIVCPISIMQRVWADAIFKAFLGKRSCIILHGSAQKRIELLKKDADFFIINHDGVGVGAHTRKKFELDGFSKALAERDDIQLAIVDEASAYKDAQTKRHKIARLVFGTKPYLWLATGSPTPNLPTDSYGLAKLVNGAFGKSFTSFRLETMQMVSKFKWKPYKDGYEKARKLLQPSIRFDLSQVWDAPELSIQQREIELTSDQKKMLADLKRDLVVASKSGQVITAANEAAARTKFIQISLGAIYDQNHKVHLIDAAPRLRELKELIEQVEGKILCFAPLTSVVELLYKELKSQVSCEIVNGNTPQNERSRIFKDFQECADPRILIADSRCMAHGLDLFAARTVCWYGPVDSAELFTQANRRAFRPGQLGPVCVVQFVSNPLEREIFRRLENNLSLQGALLDFVRDEAA